MNGPHLLFALHAAVLVVLTASSVQRLFTDVLTRVAAGFLLAWSNLVYTGLLLAVLSQLGNRWLYLAVSLTIALVVWSFIRRSVVKPVPLVTDCEAPLYATPAQRVFAYWLIGTLALGAICTLILCVRFQADNWDTLAYRYARVFFYLGHGNLLHFAKDADFRALTYPFNTTLAYLFLAIYEIGGRAFNLFSFLCWTMAAGGVYLLARVTGASKLGALVASWICAMAPIVLCEGASGNDDMIAAVPAVLATAFAVRAAKQGSRRCLLFAALGFGLGLATKLHWIFLLPLAPIILIWLLACLRRHRAWRIGLIAAAIAAPMGMTFLACNYVSSGKFTAPSLIEDGLNRPFRFDVAWQKIKISSAQLLLSPIPDLQIHFDPDSRKRTYDAFNQWTNQHWFPNVNQSLAFRVSYYRFQGIADPIGYYYFEQTLWLGFLPALLLLLGVSDLFLRCVPFPARLFIAVFFAWHLSFAVLTKYIETVGAYYTYAGVLACAGLGVAWDALQWRKHVIHKLLITGFVAVVITHLIIDFNLLAFNWQRNIPTALGKQFDGETPITRIAEPAARAIRSARHIHFLLTHWEVLHWNFMRHNPGARYTTGPQLLPSDPGVLNLISVDTAMQRLIGRMPDPGVAGLTYLGPSSSGYVFGRGANVERDRYFFIQADVTRRAGSTAIAKVALNTDAIEGVENDKDLEVRVMASAADDKRWTSRWVSAHTGRQVLEALPGEWSEILVDSRSARNPASICEVVQKPKPLLEGSCFAESK